MGSATENLLVIPSLRLLLKHVGEQGGLQIEMLVVRNWPYGENDMEWLSTVLTTDVLTIYDLMVNKILAQEFPHWLIMQGTTHKLWGSRP